MARSDERIKRSSSYFFCKRMASLLFSDLRAVYDRLLSRKFFHNKFVILYHYAPPLRMGYNALMTVVCLSVCLSVCPSVRLPVCPVPDSKLRTEGHSELKFGGKEAHDTGGP